MTYRRLRAVFTLGLMIGLAVIAPGGAAENSKIAKLAQWTKIKGQSFILPSVVAKELGLESRDIKTVVQNGFEVTGQQLGYAFNVISLGAEEAFVAYRTVGPTSILWQISPGGNIVRTLLIERNAVRVIPDDTEETLWQETERFLVSMMDNEEKQQQLVSNLIELTKRIGNEQPLPHVCRSLGLKPVGKCVMHQVGYPRGDSRSVIKDGAGHAFNFYHEPRTKLLRIVIFMANGEYGEFYLVAFDGSLLRGVKKEDGVPGVVWSALPFVQARYGLNKEFDYWRAQLPILSGEVGRGD